MTHALSAPKPPRLALAQEATRFRRARLARRRRALVEGAALPAVLTREAWWLVAPPFASSGPARSWRGRPSRVMVPADAESPAGAP